MTYEGVSGGYYAHCYKNKDFSASMGREMAGFPVKAAQVYVQKTGRAMTGMVVCPTARFEASVIVGQEATEDPGPRDSKPDAAAPSDPRRGGARRGPPRAGHQPRRLA